jgi:hypothetical protein
MFKLDDNFLKDIGLADLPEDQKLPMLKDIYDTLELRVGMRLAEQMTEEQMDEFEALVDGQDAGGDAAKQWLETNFPGYKEVVAEELAKLKAEILATSEQIISHLNEEKAA